MKKVLLALLLCAASFAHAELKGVASGSGSSYNPAAVAITGGTIDGTPIGNTTASSGKFTTLSASSTVSGAGFTTYLASPPAIGGTAPAAGAFTTLSATGAVSGSGFTTYLASPPAIGGTTPAAGSFTTLSATGTSTLAGVTATSMTNSGLTAKSFVYSGVGGLMSSTAAPTNGQVLIGSTGNAPVAATLTGTANQVSVTNGAGSITLGLPSTLAIPGTVTSVNGVTAAGTGIPVVVASVEFSAQTANLAQTTIYAVPAGQGGRYSVYMDAVVTSPGTTSTLPNSTIYWTDAVSGGTGPSANIGATSTANTTNAVSVGLITVDAKASTNIQAQTSGYASTGTAMQYDVKYLVVYWGP